MRAKLSDPFLQKLRDALDRLPLPENAPRWHVALSGGIDSSVLLTALCRLAPRAQLTALHVDHGLHPDSADWAEHCRRLAGSLDVEFLSRRISVNVERGSGLEAAARDARYAAIAELIAPDEVVMTAHHGDDQLETVLLRLFRGAGVRGLTAIAHFARFDPGYLARPLLGFTHAEIKTQAERWHLTWLDDPANDDLQHDRNFLRQRVLPELARRWPALPRAADRLAQHMRDAEQLLNEMAELDLADSGSTERVPRGAVLSLGAARQRNVLRYLIRQRGLPMPTASQLEELRQGMSVTRPDAQTTVSWPGGEARVYRDHLYLHPPFQGAVSAGTQTKLVLGRPWTGVQGRLMFERADRPGLPQRWAEEGVEVRFRRGGERFKALHRAHGRSLKQCFQEAGIVPWMRDRIPLLYRQDLLVAVGDLWVNDEVRAAASEGQCWRVSWTDHPPIH